MDQQKKYEDIVTNLVKNVKTVGFYSVKILGLKRLFGSFFIIVYTTRQEFLVELLMKIDCALHCYTHYFPKEQNHVSYVHRPSFISPPCKASALCVQEAEEFTLL